MSLFAKYCKPTVEVHSSENKTPFKYHCSKNSTTQSLLDIDRRIHGLLVPTETIFFLQPLDQELIFKVFLFKKYIL